MQEKVNIIQRVCSNFKVLRQFSWLSGINHKDESFWNRKMFAQILYDRYTVEGLNFEALLRMYSPPNL
jgi:hypothetical protein